MAANSDKEGSGRYSDAWWNRVAQDMDAHRADQRAAWGGIDELALTRYEAGLSTDEERARVEQAMRDHPALRESLEIGRALDAEWQRIPSAPNPEKPPASVPGRTARPKEKPVYPIAVGPAAIQLDADDPIDDTLRPRARKPALRWLAVAAAVIAIVGLGFVYRSLWRQGAPGVPEVVKKDTPPSHKPDTIVVEKVKDAPVNERTKFEDALAALEKSVAAGIDPKE